MDKEIDQLRAGLLKLAGENGPVGFFDAEVLSVDTEMYTCDVMLDDNPLYGVRLRAVVSDKQSIDVLPVVGTQVVIGKLGEDDFIVIAADEISSYRITTGTSILKVDSTGTRIGKGTDTVASILNELVDQVLAIAAPKNVPGLTAIKLRINEVLK